jgi:hypothetical protein
MRTLRVLILPVLLLASPPLYAAADGPSSPLPGAGLGGLVMWYVCAKRRRQEIGGWLLFYYIQLYVGVIISLGLTMFFGWRNFVPSAWSGSTALYLLSLLATVPGLLILPIQMVIAERLRRSRTYHFLHLLRLVLWCDLAAVILSGFIDLNWFPSNLVLDGLALLWPVVWLPYFYRSKRVKRVFETKDWLQPVVPAPSPV